MTITVEGISSEQAANNEGIRTYSHVYRVTATQRYTAYQIGSAPGLPLIGSQLAYDAAYCRSLTVDLTDGKLIWNVTANYSTAFEMNPNPLLDPVRVSWNGEQYQEPAVIDLNGHGILNSAGDIYDPPVMKDRARPTVTLRKNLATVPSYQFTYQNKTNDAPFTIDGVTVATGLAKIRNITCGEQEDRGGTKFRVVTIAMDLDEKNWNAKPLDQGFRQKKPVSGSPGVFTIEDCVDSKGVPVTQPALLDGSGAQIPQPTPSDAVFGDFQVYEQADYSVLPLT